MSNPYILVVDDEPDIRSLVQEILEDEGYTVSIAEDGASARAAISEQTPQLMLLDIWMPDEDGVSLLKDLKQSGQLKFPVVMISGHGTVETAMEATRYGAVDFIEKPLSLAKLLLTVEKALASSLQQTDGATAETENLKLDDLVGNSQYMQNIHDNIRQLSKRADNLLIKGQVATGKLLISRHIHRLSDKPHAPLIQLRCDSLSAANSARELLGEGSHGSLNSGYLESARGGTLFLADIDLLPESAQRLLLDVIEKNEFKRVGSLTRQQLDVRFISSSLVDIDNLIKSGEFIPELYERLSQQLLITLPLREHKEDIPALLDYYVHGFVENEGLPYRHFSLGAQNRLRNLEWPGNMLELKNLVQRLMILGTGIEIGVQEVDDSLGTPKGDLLAADFVPLSLELPLREARTLFERAYMLRQLQNAEGNIGDLAKKVGMERTHLYRKLRSLEIELNRARD